jgi:N-acetylmuramic acid 6-phosphate etherase
VEWAEDKESQGVKAIEERGLSSKDVLIGITASGQAPFVIGAMKGARQRGAKVAALSCNRRSQTFKHADYQILLDVGPEIIAGSTRMKSGTAQKLVLNMITTTAMIRLGKVYNNLMVDLVPVNSKLVKRSKRIIMLATGCDEETASKVFEESGRRPKVAIVMVLLRVSKERAETLLSANEQRIGPTLDAFKKKRKSAE